MSSGEITVSSDARQRIRSFSVLVWVAGALILAGIAFNTYIDVGFGDDGFRMIGAGDDPWEAENPPLLEPDGNVYSGDGSGLIRITLEEHGQEPYVARARSDAYVVLYVTRAADLGQENDDRARPANIGYMYEIDDEILILPEDGDLELWVVADEAWSFELVKTEVDEITDGFVSGKGNAFLVYRGDALSARFQHRGDGAFYVTVRTPEGVSERPIIESGTVDQRESWDPSDWVYFVIESDESRGVWSIDIDELATDAPEQPTPDPTSPEPTPTAAALPDQPTPSTTASRPTRGTPRE